MLQMVFLTIIINIIMESDVSKNLWWNNVAFENEIFSEYSFDNECQNWQFYTCSTFYVNNDMFIFLKHHTVNNSKVQFSFRKNYGQTVQFRMEEKLPKYSRFN